MKKNSQLSQIDVNQRKTLEKQQYRVIGSHSAVKVCGWTKNSIINKGNCYKQDFYGIKSHQCMQMTSSLYCANRCKFCWRDVKSPVSKTWYGNVDDVKFIVDNSIKEHVKLLQGFKGFEGADEKKLEELKSPRHVALSLTGEPIVYPKINKLLEEFHKRNISTFLVTNAQFPSQIVKIKNITQLYLSIDAPTKELMKEIDRPLFKDYWQRSLKSLKILSTRKYRTCIRLTLIKGLNDGDEYIQDYAKLIKLGKPHFVEIKSYMYVGASQKQLKHENMLSTKEINSFTKKLLKYLKDYEYAADHWPSRVSLIMKKSLKKKRFINFDKFFKIVNAGKSASVNDYSCLN
ncbi:MAG: 4-demethylwyosine synthase TYW1 [Candidatus Pacearchaeota archaeon]|jgi:tRNA wybutosine-synthesizing protein 1